MIYPGYQIRGLPASHNLILYFLNKKVKCLEQFHYEELVEERFLSKICGYSICSTELKEVFFFT
jgi:hypothetical protein